jgi:hypothetical protein
MVADLPGTAMSDVLFKAGCVEGKGERRKMAEGSE